MATPVVGSPTYYRDSLAEVNAAITGVTRPDGGSQRYRIGDREVWRGDLEWLYSERARLEPLAAREARGGLKIKRVVPL